MNRDCPPSTQDWQTAAWNLKTKRDPHGRHHRVYVTPAQRTDR